MRLFTLFMLLALIGLGIYVTGVSITGQSAALMERELVGCSLSTGIDFLRIDNTPQACYKDNRIYFSVENIGSSEISGLLVKLEADYDLTMRLKDELATGSMSQHDLGFGAQSLSGVKLLTVEPMITAGGGSTLCDNAAISVALEKC